MERDLAVQEPKSEIVLASEKIRTGLAAFETRKAELNALKAEVDGLDITSVEDKAGVKQVTEGRKKLKSARVEIEKEGKSMRDPLTALAKLVSQKEKELVDIIEPTEKKLAEKEKWVKDENDRIARETEEKEKARIQARIDSLAVYGYQIDYNMLVSLNNEDFARIVENARVEHEKDLKLKEEQAEADRLKAEQQEKERQELIELRRKAEESERIIREREEEVARKEAAIKGEEDRQRAEQEKSKIAIFKRRLEDRINLIVDLGLRWDSDGDQYVGYSCFVPMLDMKVHSDEDWAKLIAEIMPVIKRGKLEEEARMEAEEKERVAAKEKELELIRDQAAVKALADLKAKEEEAAKQEAERIAAASDKDKLFIVISYIENCSYPEVKSAKAKKLMAEVKDLNAKVVAHIKAKM